MIFREAGLEHLSGAELRVSFPEGDSSGVIAYSTTFREAGLEHLSGAELRVSFPEGRIMVNMKADKRILQVNGRIAHG
jgi:hypothetical protein